MRGKCFAACTSTHAYAVAAHKLPDEHEGHLSKSQAIALGVALLGKRTQHGFCTQWHDHSQKT